MTRYHVADGTPVEWYATKYDDCTAHSTGRAYRLQEGSGRSTVISRFYRDGAKLGDISKEAALEGWDPAFVVDCGFKQHSSKQNAWEVHAPEGKTLEEMKSIRKPRELTEEQIANREKTDAEKAEKAAQKALEKEQKAMEKERKSAQMKADRERERAEARRIMADNKAAAEAAGEPEEVEDVAVDDVPVKSKRKAKAPSPTPEELSQAAEA